MKSVYSFITAIFLISSSSMANSECQRDIKVLDNQSAKDISKVTQTYLRSTKATKKKSTPSNKLSSLDKRIVKSSSSPKYLDAVGSILNIKKDGKVGSCSGSLVGDEGTSSRVVLTSNHCFNADTKKIVWKSKTKNGFPVIRTAKIISRDIDNDIAILLLDRIVDKNLIQPLEVPSKDSEIETAYSVMEQTGELYYAGYSADKEIGNSGRVLTYETSKLSWIDEVNNVKDHEIWPKQGVYEVNTFTFQGASGGSGILYWDSDFDDVPDKPILFAVIKGGSAESKLFTSANGATGSNDTHIVGLEKFRDDVAWAVARYNK